MYIYHIDYPNLRGGLGGTVSDCLCHLHGDQVQLVETKWMAIIKVEAKNAVRRRAEAMKGGLMALIRSVKGVRDIMSLRRVRDSCWWMIEVKRI